MLSSVPTRQSLLDAVLGGQDGRAWWDFVHAYAPMVMAIAKRQRLSDADADEIVEGTLTTVLRYFGQLEKPFDRSKGKFRAWLHGVVKHQILDARRRAWRRGRHEGGVLPEDHPDAKQEALLDEIIELEWQRNLLARALDEARQTLTPKVFQAFQLYELDRQPVRKVAKLLEIEPGTVYVYKRRTLLELRRNVERMRVDEG